MKHRRLSVGDTVQMDVGEGPHTGEVIAANSIRQQVRVRWDDGVVGTFADDDLGALDRIDIPEQRKPSE